MSAISQAQEKFGELIQSEFERIERMKQDTEVKDFSKLDKIVRHPSRRRYWSDHYGAGSPRDQGTDSG